MEQLKISMGIWGINNLPDRFNVQGFGDFVPVVDRIKIIGETPGVDGIELHLPTEIDDLAASHPEKVREQAPACGYVIPELGQNVPVRSPYNSGTLLVTGSSPDFEYIRSISVAQGRYPNHEDEAEVRRSAGDIDGALEALREARRIDPEDPTLMQQFGTVVLDAGQSFFGGTDMLTGGKEMPLETFNLLQEYAPSLQGENPP